jgi:ribonuclease VapC
VILDSSAIVAVFFREARSDEFVDKILSRPQAGIGAPTVVETAVVLSARMNSDSRALLSRLLTELSIEVIPFDSIHWSVAVGAWLRFGKGRHEARLNFGDCLSYAVAKVSGLPLLCVGEDFRKTDLLLA